MKEFLVEMLSDYAVYTDIWRSDASFLHRLRSRSAFAGAA